jgi:hypothetical protein
MIFLVLLPFWGLVSRVCGIIEVVIVGVHAAGSVCNCFASRSRHLIGIGTNGTVMADKTGNCQKQYYIYSIYT